MSGVGVGKQHPAPRQPLDVRRFVETGGSVQRRIAPAEIIGENEHDVGAPGGVDAGQSTDEHDPKQR